MAYEKELAVARDVVQKAGEIQLTNQSKLRDIELKSDMSPVTEVDRQCEQLIRDALLGAFPQDGFIGEESGDKPGTSGRRWIVDPLDGTRPYIRGIHTYSILIALEENSEFVIGIAHFPAIKETYRASTGEGAFCNGNRIHVSQTRDVTQVMGSCLGIIEKADSEEGKKLFSLMRQWDYTYGFMDAYSYMSLASGKLDVCISLIDKPWDRAAAACIVTEAGGQYSDLSGNRTVHSSSFVLSNGSLHDSIIKHFTERQHQPDN